MTERNMSEGDSSRQHMLNRLRAQKMSRYFLLFVLLGISFVFFQMLSMFLMPVFLAAVFCGLTYPIYEKLCELLRGNKGISAFLCCLMVILLVLGPVAFLVDVVRVSAIDFYGNHQEKVQEFIKNLNATVLNDLRNSELLQRLGVDVDNLDLNTYLRQAAEGVGRFLLGIIGTTRQGIEFIVQFVIMLFTMYYFYKDGERLIEWAKYLSPLDDRHEDAIINRFRSVSRATIKGTLLIGLIQGSLGGLVLWLFGFNAAVLWGMVMVVLSIIPMVGAWGVMVPAGIYEIFIGNFWSGIAIILISSIFIGNIDNFLRPKLVGRDAGMHDLMIFFSTIGGLSVFGLMGFILGPVIAVLFLTVLEIYSIEFKSLLDVASGHPNPLLDRPGMETYREVVDSADREGTESTETLEQKDETSKGESPDVQQTAETAHAK